MDAPETAASKRSKSGGSPPESASSAPRARKSWNLVRPELELVLAETRRLKARSLWRDAWARIQRDRSARWSLNFLLGFALLSFFTPLLPLPSPITLELKKEPVAPVWPWEALYNDGYVPEIWELGWLDQRMFDARYALLGGLQTGHWLGTDAKGRDLLARILWGSRTSMLVALAAASCSLVIGVLYGAIAGLAGGRVDRAMMRLVDVFYSLPFTFLVIFILSLLGAPRADLESEPLVSREKVFFVVIGAVSWLSMARVVRGQVLALKRAEFVQAARVLGASSARILFVHVVPNVLSIVVVYLTLTLPAVILFESFLSFLGLGVESPRVSWGLLAADALEAINPMHVFWWLVIGPSLAMGATLLALNFLGDGLRDALDPRRGGSAR